MRTVTRMHKGQTTQRRAERDAELLKDSGVHKLVITDRDGNCLAYLLAWDSFVYDPDIDAFVCCADRDGRELMNIHTEGEVKPQPGTDTYVVTAPDAHTQAAHPAGHNGFPAIPNRVLPTS